MNFNTSFYLFAVTLAYTQINGWFILIYTISFVIYVFITGGGIYGALFEVLLFGTYRESLRVRKTKTLFEFVIILAIMGLYLWFFDIRTDILHLNVENGMLFEMPMAILFILSILLTIRVRSIKGVRS
ncbi:MAG: hypothetical protein ACYDAP_07860 [Thermoplasmataceae archaeon]